MDGQTAFIREFHFKANSFASIFALALAIVLALTLLTSHAIEAQTFTVLHQFTGGTDGQYPFAGVTVGPGGVLYGTASGGGPYNDGTVFKLSQVNSAWVFSPLYEFTGNNGGGPEGGVVIGPNGSLYGTTESRGAYNYGTVFELTPPATFCKSIQCYWNETLLYSFMRAPDGQNPQFENLAFDQAGNIYGTTQQGGMYAGGTAFELTPSAGGYTERIIHSFGSGTDGEYPDAGVVLDGAGNVYGTTPLGGTGNQCNTSCGTVYQLVPSNGGWLENVLVNFDGANGYFPYSNLIIDQSGNLYGTTVSSVFRLAPSGGGFAYSVLYTFSSLCSSFSGVAMDAAGDFFGVCEAGGNIGGACGNGGCGYVFELTNCSNTCMVTDLHDFIGSDGSNPYGAPVLGANGDLYGTTYLGGTGNCEDGCGVVWEIAGVGAQHRN
jgi:uncharacterized repeat protein (TIGR03803 family)